MFLPRRWNTAVNHDFDIRILELPNILQLLQGRGIFSLNLTDIVPQLGVTEHLELWGMRLEADDVTNRLMTSHPTYLDLLYPLTPPVAQIVELDQVFPGLGGVLLGARLLLFLVPPRDEGLYFTRERWTLGSEVLNATNLNF